MTSRPTRVLIAVLATMSFAGTAVAYAHSSSFNKQVRAALRDCASTRNGSLKHHYSLKVLQTALHEVKAEALQYTGCADVLEAAIHRAALGAPKTTPSVNPHKTQRVTKPTRPVIVKHGQKAIKRKVDRLKHDGGTSLTFPGGQTVTPGVVTAHSAGFLSTLPTPLLIVLAALLAAVVAVAGRALHNVVRARRSR
jgi:nitrogen fixation protein FixH